MLSPNGRGRRYSTEATGNAGIHARALTISSGAPARAHSASASRLRQAVVVLQALASALRVDLHLTLVGQLDDNGVHAPWQPMPQRSNGNRATADAQRTCGAAALMPPAAPGASRLPQWVEGDEHQCDEPGQDKHAKDDGICVAMDALEHVHSHLSPARKPLPSGTGVSADLSLMC